MGKYYPDCIDCYYEYAGDDFDNCDQCTIGVPIG